jgi:hypothetical protein
MTPQTPAEGILKTGDWGNSTTYHIACECGNSECSHDIDIEADDYGISVTFYTEQKTPWWKRRFADNHNIDNPVLDRLDRSWRDLANGVWRRVSLTWDIWVHGYVKYEAGIILKEQAALNYGATLITAAEECRVMREEWHKKKAERDAERAARKDAK